MVIYCASFVFVWLVTLLLAVGWGCVRWYGSTGLRTFAAGIKNGQNQPSALSLKGRRDFLAIAGRLVLPDYNFVGVYPVNGPVVCGPAAPVVDSISRQLSAAPSLLVFVFMSSHPTGLPYDNAAYDPYSYASGQAVGFSSAAFGYDNAAPGGGGQFAHIGGTATLDVDAGSRGPAHGFGGGADPGSRVPDAGGAPAHLASEVSDDQEFSLPSSSPETTRVPARLFGRASARSFENDWPLLLDAFGGWSDVIQIIFGHSDAIRQAMKSSTVALRQWHAARWPAAAVAEYIEDVRREAAAHMVVPYLRRADAAIFEEAYRVLLDKVTALMASVEMTRELARSAVARRPRSREEPGRALRRGGRGRRVPHRRREGAVACKEGEGGGPGAGGGERGGRGSTRAAGTGAASGHAGGGGSKGREAGEGERGGEAGGREGGRGGASEEEGEAGGGERGRAGGVCGREDETQVEAVAPFAAADGHEGSPCPALPQPTHDSLPLIIRELLVHLSLALLPLITLPPLGSQRQFLGPACRSLFFLPPSSWDALAAVQLAEFKAWLCYDRAAMAGARSTQRRVFLFGLPACDRSVFESGRRLAPDVRRSLVSSLPDDVVSASGLHWADEAVPGAALSPQGVAALLGIPAEPDAASSSALEALSLDAWLAADPLLLDLCLDGLSHGANLCYEGPRRGSLSVPNYGSSLEHAAFVSGELESEQQRGWLSRWFDSPPLPHSRVAAIGTVSKDGGSMRLTLDLSAGGDLATNEGTPKLFSRFPDYASIAQSLIGSFRSVSGRLGEGVAAWLIKLDVASAFRLVPVRKADLHLALFEWGGRFACPLRTFGGRASPGIWERYGFLFELLIALWAPDGTEIVRWVDDFLLICVCSACRAQALVSLVRFLGERYGFPQKVEKLLGPCHRLESIGWEFDVSPSLREPTVSVPAGKREKFARSASITLACPSRMNFDKFLGRAFNFSSVFSGLRAACLHLSAVRHSLPHRGAEARRAQEVPGEARIDISWLADTVSALPPSPFALRGALRHAVSRNSADVWVRTDAGTRFGQGFVVLRAQWLRPPLIDWGWRAHSVEELSCSFVCERHASAVLEAYVPSTFIGAVGRERLGGLSIFFELDSQSAALALDRGAEAAPELDEAVRRVRSSLVVLHCVVRGLVAFSLSSSLAVQRAPELVGVSTALLMAGPFRQRIEVVHQKVVPVTPIENAIETTRNKTLEFAAKIHMVLEASDEKSLDLNPLTMALNGILDAAVNGGAKKYTDAFLSEVYLKDNPTHGVFQKDLKQALRHQLEALKKGLGVFGERCGESYEGLHEHLKRQYGQMRETMKDLLQ
eukprot:g52088.t1